MTVSPKASLVPDHRGDLMPAAERVHPILDVRGLDSLTSAPAPVRGIFPRTHPKLGR